MPNYTPYPTVATTPSRKTRKAQRKRIFEENSLMANKERKARRLAKKELK